MSSFKGRRTSAAKLEPRSSMEATAIFFARIPSSRALEHLASTFELLDSVDSSAASTR